MLTDCSWKEALVGSMPIAVISSSSDEEEPSEEHMAEGW